MKPYRNLRYRFAYALLRHAGAVMPAHRHEWIRAMHVELEHIEQNHVLRWAIGGVIACYSERLKMMNRSSLIVSRGVLAAEVLTCFIPATMLWIFALLNVHSLTGLHIIATSVLLMAVVPINLWFALKFVTGKGPSHQKMHLVSAGILAVLSLLQLVSMANDGSSAVFAWFQLDFGLSLMFFVLPAISCWHLSLFGRDGLERSKAWCANL